jgi:predicted ATPase
VRICRQLDGIPLALELAAAWVRVLLVDQIAAQLDSSFDLLVSGTRTAAPRHRTLSATIQWSYDLIADNERRLFEDLCVFRGGFTLEGAQAASGTSDVLACLARLVDHSLVQAEHDDTGAVRYRLLEPVRQFGEARLEARGAANAVRARHANYFVELAEAAQVALWGVGQRGSWLPRLARDHDNLRAALRWLIDQADTERAQLLGAYLARYWMYSRHVKEGRAWLGELMAMPGSPAVSFRTRGRMLVAATSAASYDGDPGGAIGLPEEAVAAAREAGDPWCLAFGMFFRALLVLYLERNSDHALAIVEEGIEAARQAGDPVLEATLLGVATLVRLA